MESVTTLYNETKELWKQKGKNSKGFAIFYSPPVGASLSVTGQRLSVRFCSNWKEPWI